MTTADAVDVEGFTNQSDDPGAASAVQDGLPEAMATALHPVVADIQAKYEDAKNRRQEDELRWVRAYYNFRGLYGKEIEFQDSEKSRVFVKVTKTKVMAAFGSLLDVVLSKGRLPITIEATPDPTGIEEDAYVDPKEQGQADPNIGFTGDGQDLAPGETQEKRFGTILKEQFNKLAMKAGYSPNPASTINVRPADVAAKRMNKKIHDQLVETDAVQKITGCAFEMALLGSGVIKGPFKEDKEYPYWNAQGEYTPKIKAVPQIDQPSIWNIYPDPDSLGLGFANWIIERHKMGRAQLRGLKKRPFFRASGIEEVIAQGTNWERQWWEHELDDSGTGPNYPEDRYEVLEYWGTMDGASLEEYEDVPGIDDMELIPDEEYQVNVWMCGGVVLRMVLNPFTPARMPYHVCHYETNPYSFFGVGVAENMEDSQTIMNGFARMAIDNAVLAGHLMIEVDESNLVPGQDMRITAGKIWRRNGGAPGQAVFGTTWPNTTESNLRMFDKFRQIADEAVGIPSYSHGQTGVTGTTRTASGMSMLMGASAINIKTVIKNMDITILKPLGDAYFAFNMQFDFDPDIRGDLAVKASGTTSLMAREMHTQRLMQFMQTSANPLAAPWVNMEYVMEEGGPAGPPQQQAQPNEPAQGGNPSPGGEQPQGGTGGMMGANGAPAGPGQGGFSGGPANG
jgi:hypothetical protein